MKNKGKKYRSPPSWSWGNAVKINSATADRFPLSIFPGELPVNKERIHATNREGNQCIVNADIILGYLVFCVCFDISQIQNNP